MSGTGFYFWFTLIGFGLLVFGAALYWSEGSGISYSRQRRACDILVQRLMTTDDPVEVRRDEILIRHLNCDVVRRAVPVLVP